MLEPWNNSNILPPPINMFLSVEKVDIPALKNICNNILKVLSKQSPLHKESALCSRFLYKYDRKFRNDIGYRNLKKVHTALKRYLTLNLIKDAESFISALPSGNDDEKYLPTRQMLEYLMLRIIAFSKIMLRICVCSKQAAIFYLNRVKRSESHWMSLLPYALLSRLWSMTLILAQHSVNWYSNLYPYLNKLQLKGLAFLPDNYVLPEDLEQWLDLKNVDCFGRFNWDQRKIIVENNALLADDDDNDLFDNILNFVNQTNTNYLEEEEESEMEFKPMYKSKEYPSFIEPTIVNIDQGEVQSREGYKIDHGTIVSRESFRKDQSETLTQKSFNILHSTQISNCKASNQNPSVKNNPMSNNLNSSEHNRQKLSEKSNVKANNQNPIERSKPIKQSKAQSNKVVRQLKVTSKDSIAQENKSHCHKSVTNATSLKEFIDKEEKYRSESDNRSLTNHLSLMQWHALKNASLKLCDALTNRKVERKFQQIWQQKCLDYK